MNENMGEEVKITVIATGFEREGLPTIERKRGAGDPAPAPPAQMEIPQTESVHAEAAAEPAAEPEPMTMAAAATAPAAPVFDDLDVPAILRRDRRFVQ
jgi:cell division protein FtsZ